MSPNIYTSKPEVGYILHCQPNRYETQKSTTSHVSGLCSSIAQHKPNYISTNTWNTSTTHLIRHSQTKNIFKIWSSTYSCLLWKLSPSGTWRRAVSYQYSIRTCSLYLNPSTLTEAAVDTFIRTRQARISVSLTHTSAHVAALFTDRCLWICINNDKEACVYIWWTPWILWRSFINCSKEILRYDYIYCAPSCTLRRYCLSSATKTGTDTKWRYSPPAIRKQNPDIPIIFWNSLK